VKPKVTSNFKRIFSFLIFSYLKKLQSLDMMVSYSFQTPRKKQHCVPGILVWPFKEFFKLQVSISLMKKEKNINK